MGTFGHPWGPIGTVGDPMRARGDLWGHVGTYGDLWGSLRTFEELCGPMGAYGNLWSPITSMVTFRNSVRTHVFGVTSCPPSRTPYTRDLTIFYISTLSMLFDVCDQSCWQSCVTPVEIRGDVLALCIPVF